MEEYCQCYGPDAVIKRLNRKGQVLNSHWHNETTDTLRLWWSVCPRNSRILLVKLIDGWWGCLQSRKPLDTGWMGQWLWALNQGCSHLYQHHPIVPIQKLTIFDAYSLKGWGSKEGLASPTSVFFQNRQSILSSFLGYTSSPPLLVSQFTP